MQASTCITLPGCSCCLLHCKPYNNSASQPRLPYHGSDCITVTAEAVTEFIPPPELLCLLSLTRLTAERHWALLKVKLACFRLYEECINQYQKLQESWSPLASAFVFTHWSSQLHIQDTSGCTFVQDKVIAVGSTSLRNNLFKLLYLASPWKFRALCIHMPSPGDQALSTKAQFCITWGLPPLWISASPQAPDQVKPYLQMNIPHTSLKVSNIQTVSKLLTKPWLPLVPRDNYYQSLSASLHATTWMPVPALAFTWWVCCLKLLCSLQSRFWDSVLQRVCKFPSISIQETFVCQGHYHVRKVFSSLSHARTPSLVKISFQASSVALTDCTIPLFLLIQLFPSQVFLQHCSCMANLCIPAASAQFRIGLEFFVSTNTH